MITDLKNCVICPSLDIQSFTYLILDMRNYSITVFLRSGYYSFTYLIVEVDITLKENVGLRLT